MATVGTLSLTLADHAKRTNDRKIQTVVEILNKHNDVLQSILWREANQKTGHKTTVRSGLPSATWRMLYQSVQPTKSTTVQVTDTIGGLETYSQTDVALADLEGNRKAFLLSENVAFIEGLAQQMATAIFYANTDTDPEQILGLSPRYNSLSATNGGQIIDGGGTGSDNTSIWMTTWGDRYNQGLFPRGSKAGLMATDKGQVTEGVSSTGYMEMYRTHYKWQAGLSVRDWRYNVRIANIDVTDLTKAAASGADLVDLLIQAAYVHENSDAPNTVIFCNKTIKSFLHRQLRNDSNMNLSYGKDEFGREVLMFMGIPIRRCDALVNTEATVS